MPNWNIVLSIATSRVNSKARELAPTLEEYIKSLYSSGMPVSEIRSRLLGEEGERLIFAPIRKAFGVSSAGAIEQSRQRVERDTFKANAPEDSKYAWVMNELKKHCEGCIENSLREPMTMAEWELIGTPDAKITECGDNCGCSLVLLKG